MPRNLALFALVLMLMTGLVLGQMSNLGQKPIQIAATSDSGAAEIARAFYRAINLYLETGEEESLEQILAPGFVGHAPHRAGDESAEEFLQYLESMRSTFPGLRLEVSDLSAQAGMVAMDVTLTGNTSGFFAGLALDAGSSASGYEVLHVERQQIAERWGSREMPPLFQSVISAEMSLPANTISEPRIERLEFEPNGVLEFIDHDGFLLIAETEAIAYQVVGYPVDRSDPGMAPESAARNPGLRKVGSSVELAAGQSIRTPAGVRFRIVNSGTERASALMISIRQGQFGMGNVVAQEVTESIGMNRTLLVGGGSAPAQFKNDSRAVAVGQIVLPPGSEIPPHLVGDAELLVVIEGEIDVTVHSGTVVWNQPGKTFAAVTDAQTISACEGARANPGAVMEYRAGSEEPATLWILTILGDGSELQPEG